MTTKTKRISIPAIIAMAALALIGPTVAFAQDAGGLKLDGAWIARVVEVNDIPFPLLAQWSYVLAPDASGRKATLHGSIDIPMPGPAGFDYTTPLLGEVIQTGPDTVADTAIWYAIRKATPVNQIVTIGTATSEGRWLGAGRMEYTLHFAIYLPGADANGDGLPDADAVPVNTFKVKTVDTRVGF